VSKPKSLANGRARGGGWERQHQARWSRARRDRLGEVEEGQTWWMEETGPSGGADGDHI